MSWVKRNSDRGPLVKWTTVGQVLEGTYQGMKNGKQFPGQSEPGKLGTVLQADGQSVTAPFPTTLRREMEPIAVGTLVRIVYKGKTQGKTALYHDFDVFTQEAGAPVPPAAQPAPAAPAGTPDIADMRAKLQARVGADATEAMVSAITTKYGADADGIKSALVALLSAHGIKSIVVALALGLAALVAPAQATELKQCISWFATTPNGQLVEDIRCPAAFRGVAEEVNSGGASGGAGAAGGSGSGAAGGSGAGSSGAGAGSAGSAGSGAGSGSGSGSGASGSGSGGPGAGGTGGNGGGHGQSGNGGNGVGNGGGNGSGSGSGNGGNGNGNGGGNGANGNSK